MGSIDDLLELTHSDAFDEHRVAGRHQYAFLTDYDFGDTDVARKLARQSENGMWSVDQLDWDTPFDPNLLAPLRDSIPRMPRFHPGNTWDKEAWQRYEIANLRYILSQGLHGEQLGVVVGGELCQSGPTWDVKKFAGFMAADEVRHAQAFHRYLERIGGAYPMNDHMYSVVREVLGVRNWDKVYLVGQVLIEGLGLGTFGYLIRNTNDPLLQEMLRLAMRDEARHVAFGATQLRELVDGLSDTELMERLELVAYCAELLVNRLIAVSVAEEFEIDAKQYVRAVRMSPALRNLEMNLFAHVSPICARLGLLDRCDGWLRNEFEKIGILDIPGQIGVEAEKTLDDAAELSASWYATI
jgi:1,2-phenylacetyl-CoA epoxidase catalytic subunit